MKTLLYASLFAALFFMVGCKKDDCPKPVDAQRIVGKWLGKYSNTDAATPSANVFFEIKTGGELIVHDGRTAPDAPDAQKALGTWTLNGNTFRCTFKFLTLDVNRSIQATLTNDNNLKGFRGENGAVTGKGQIELNKQ